MARNLEKTNALLNQMKEEDDDDYSVIDKIDLYVKDPNEEKYQYLIKQPEFSALLNNENLMR